MKRKGLAAVGLAAMLIFAMTGCGSDATDTAGQNGSSAEEQGTENAKGVTTDVENSEDVNGEYTKIVYSYWTMDRIPDEASRQSVEEAINEITREKIGVEVELMPLAASEQAQKVSLAMASGEQLDIFNTVGDLNTYIANNQVYDITDLVHEHAQGAVEQVSEEFLKTTMNDGKIYAIPADKGIALAARSGL